MKKILSFIFIFLLSASSVLAATTTYMDGGTDATQDLTFYAGTTVTSTGSVTSSATQAHTGLRSLLLANGASQGIAIVRTLAGSVTDAGSRFTFWVYLSSTPTSAGSGPEVTNSSGQACFQVRLQTTRKLNIDNAGGTDLSTGVTAIPLNTWTRVTVAYTLTSATVFSIKVYINGVLDSSATNNGTLVRTGSSEIGFIGPDANAPANSLWYFDDIYADNGSDLGDPGAIQITAKRPFANGTTNGFTTQIGAGGSGYGTGHAPQVNEQPLSTTNGWSMVGSGSAITEEYNIEGQTVGDVNTQADKIVDSQAWVFASSLAGETGQIINNGNNTNISLTNTNTVFTNYAGSTSYPAGTGSDVGLITSNALTTVSLYEAGIQIAYIPPTAKFFNWFQF